MNIIPSNYFIGFLVLFIGQANLALSQKSDPYHSVPPYHAPPYEIQHISLEGTPLYNTLKEYISRKFESNTRFSQGFGYVAVKGIMIGQISKRPVDVSTLEKGVPTPWDVPIATFWISMGSHTFVPEFYACTLCTEYPQFYTVISGRPILIYDSVLTNVLSINEPREYSKRSIKRLAKLVYPYLKNTLHEDFVFLNIELKEYKLSREKRKGISKLEIFEEAVWTATASDEREDYTVLRDGRIIKN